MKNLKRFLGIIAFVAVIGLVMTACGEDATSAEAEGTVSIQVSPYGAFTGEPLKAVYTGTEEVRYFWFKQETGVPLNFQTDYDVAPNGKRLNSSLTADTYTPTVDGTYSVAVVVYDAVVFADLSRATLIPKWNPVAGNVTVATATPGYPFYGTWLMKGADNDNWKPETVAPVSNETIVINQTSFKLDSTYTNSTGPEKIYWNITSWTELTGGSLTVGGVTYQKGFALVCTIAENNGYGSFNNFNIFMLPGTTQLVMQRANADGTILTRKYIKQ